MTSPWGTLQYIDKDVAPVLLRNRKFVVGRAAGEYISVFIIPENRMLTVEFK